MSLIGDFNEQRGASNSTDDHIDVNSCILNCLVEL